MHTSALRGLLQFQNTELVYIPSDDIDQHQQPYTSISYTELTDFWVTIALKVFGVFLHAILNAIHLSFNS